MDRFADFMAGKAKVLGDSLSSKDFPPLSRGASHKGLLRIHRARHRPLFSCLLQLIWGRLDLDGAHFLALIRLLFFSTMD